MQLASRVGVGGLTTKDLWNLRKAYRKLKSGRVTGKIVLSGFLVSLLKAYLVGHISTIWMAKLISPVKHALFSI
jgi:hypothetical protein